ncbi:diaminopropionate ammonia-lyase [Loktanella sp. PT4BL]|jgi:diaminopropionate ammonia-lyase|uniref:pyridoxal-phosphate dependent enzyme n=1 Tax=Loktanella sp. PT4BL TaxID=2135611 RepID=UPI000D7514B8|nr:pyridoxal-phosphate dependent enzyme [Loktanella sp. PT4BL]PXW72067.1 diaminopropionate ammonia-lyase [Loktanella sp. PT4BL]
MAEIYKNTVRGHGLADPAPGDAFDTEAVTRLLDQCPAHHATPLLDCEGLARITGAARVVLKDERTRMGLGSFKALGAAHVIARDAADVVRDTGVDWCNALNGRSYVAASAGNHGLSLAAGAAVFGARAVIYLADTVPEGFAARLRAKGAEVVRAGANYEESMAAASVAAEEGDLQLLSDGSWPGYTRLPFHVMEGYTQMGLEIAQAYEGTPTHVFLQAGVGGLAAALAESLRAYWGDGPRMIVVEPEAAPALIASMKAEALVTTQGPVSNMGRLDCKTPSMLALGILARDADDFTTITEGEAEAAVAALAEQGIRTTPSGAAGVAAALAGVGDIDSRSNVLCIISEGPEDG